MGTDDDVWFLQQWADVTQCQDSETTAYLVPAGLRRRTAPGRTGSPRLSPPGIKREDSDTQFLD